MVWENGCVVIVMLTPLVEGGVKQCYHYWPDEGSNLYHIYEVPVCLPTTPPVCLSHCLPVCLLSVFLSFHLSVCLSAQLYVCLSLCLSVCLSFCLSKHFGDVLRYQYKLLYVSL